MSKDVVVIGSGPNGLAAAVRMAQAGCNVQVFETETSCGGGSRSLEMTLPGFIHDHCSAVHPLGVGSPYFRTLPLAEHGLEWIHPSAPLAHPLDGGVAVVLERSISATAQTLGCDANAYMRLMAPLIPDWDTLCNVLLSPIKAARYPFELARFGLIAIQPAKRVVDTYFRGAQARALFAGLAAHSFLPLDQSPTAAFGLALGIMGHAVGWPFPRGGSGRIADALVSLLKSAGGSLTTGNPITSLDEFAADQIVLADTNAHGLSALAGDRLPDVYRRKLDRFRPGTAVFKVDYAMDAPIPWSAQECLRAGTVHLGGTFEEIAESEAAVARGEHPGRPFVLLAQQSLFDPTRAPEGKQTVWAYCHVPLGSTVDRTSAIEAQIERFAPGFSQRILARRVTTPADLESSNPNLAGGDITGEAYTPLQMLARPVWSTNPWQTGARNLYLCSASTPPGGGVHGMCGYYAAESALRDMRRKSG